MRSAETSGVRANSFGASRTFLGLDLSGPRKLAHFLSRRWTDAGLRVTPLTLGVAAGALIAVVAFVGVDTVRTLDDTSARMGVVARALADEIAPLDKSVASLVLTRKATAYDPDLVAKLAPWPKSGAPTMPVASDAVQVRATAGVLGTLTLSLERSAVLAGVWRRGLIALAGALALIGASCLIKIPGPNTDRAGKVRLAALVRSLPLGVACWTEKGKLVVCNAHYLAHVGEARGTRKALDYHDAIRGLTRGGYVKLVNEGEDNRLIELHHEDGSCLLIDERPLGNGGFVTLVTDITEAQRTNLLLDSIQQEQRQLARRYREEKLRAEAASTAKTSFLAHLSHDIRTPLNHIIGFADLIAHQTYGPLGDTRYLDYVKAIKGSGERMLASFAAILDLAELESGQRVLRTEHFEAEALLRATVRRFAAQANRAGLTLKNMGACPAVLAGDRFCLERMLGNLVENAIRFTPSGGRVTLAAYAARDGVVFEVTDTGIGMTEERLANLSHPFAYADATFTREHEGAGLGIAVSRAIAELSGGRLAIDSSPALGTTVAICLPLAGHNGERAEAA